MGNVNMEAYQIHTSDKDAPTVQKALDSLKSSESQTAEALAVKADRIDIATIFSTETAYTAGDLVYHSNRLWKFTTDHAAGAWNAEEVEASNIDMAIKAAGSSELIFGSYSGTTSETGLLTPDPAISADDYFVMGAYGSNSKGTLPIVAASDSTWRFIVFQPNTTTPVVSDTVTVYYVLGKISAV